MTISEFRNYYDLFYEPLCRFLNFYTQDTMLMEDILQDVFLKLWENHDLLEVEHIKTYLFHTTRNKVLNHLRDEENRHQLLERWLDQQLLERKGRECFDLEQFSAMVNRAIDQLPPKCREIFILSRYEQQTYKEIADKLGLSVKTVEAQMGIALKRLRDTFSTATFGLLMWMIHG